MTHALDELKAFNYSSFDHSIWTWGGSLHSNSLSDRLQLKFVDISAQCSFIKSPVLLFLLSFQFIFSFKWLELNWSQVKWFETKSKLLFQFLFSLQTRSETDFLVINEIRNSSGNLFTLSCCGGKTETIQLESYHSPFSVFPPSLSLSPFRSLSLSHTHLLSQPNGHTRTRTHVSIPRNPQG